MEQLNRIELRGIVGTIRVQTVSDRKVARISLVTNYVYKSKEGEGIIETTWHNISAWEGRNIQDLSAIKKGDALQVTGRMRCQQYTASDGNERTMYEVAAYKLAVINMDEPLQYEF